MERKSGIRSESGSLGKALSILQCFVDRQEHWGVKELSVALGLPGSTVHRFLKIFCAEGYLVFDPEKKKYEVGMELYRISSVLSRRNRVRELARRFMRATVEQTGESCWLAMYVSTDGTVVFVDEIEGPKPFRYNTPIGKREYLTESAAGLSVLAHLPATERDRLGLAHPMADTELANLHAKGYAESQQSERALGRIIAATIFDSGENPVGCLGIGLSDARGETIDLDEAVGTLIENYRRLSQSLGSRLLAGGGAGSWHLSMGVIADIVNARVSDIGLNASWGAGLINLDELERGNAGYCMAVAASLDAAYEGRAPFSQPHRKLRAVYNMFPLYLHVIARRDTQATELNDLRGLRISPAEKGFTTAFVFEKLFRRAMRRRGDHSSREFSYLDYAEANRQFSDHKLDVIASLTAIPNPPYLDLAKDPGIKLIGLSDKNLDEFIVDEPSCRKAVIPAGTYPGVDHDVSTLMVPTVLCTNSDRSEQEVYEVAKSIYERRSELVLAVEAYRDFGLDTAFSDWAAPMHPGAERFRDEFQESGRPRSTRARNKASAGPGPGTRTLRQRL